MLLVITFSQSKSILCKHHRFGNPFELQWAPELNPESPNVCQKVQIYNYLVIFGIVPGTVCCPRGRPNHPKAPGL